MKSNNRDYERLIEPIEDQMIRSMWRIIRDSDDVDEAFQNALVIIWKRLPHIHRHSNPHALILRICINSAYDILRKKTRQMKCEDTEAIDTDYPVLSPLPDEQLIVQENHKEILQAIGQLPRKQAEIVLMRFVQELSYKDISDAMGCREVTIRKHINRARTQLRKMLVHLAPHPLKEMDNDIIR